MRHESHHEKEERAHAAQAVDDDVPPNAAPPPDSPDSPDPPGEPPDGRDSFDTGGGDGEGPELDEVDVKDLLRAAMEAPGSSSRRIAEGVHRKIYEASGGRFFADGWSTTPAPRATYIVTSVLMLIVIALAWLLLSPWGL